ncbi:MAG: hypothetical protein AAGB16_06320, partial [Pseudomonadota bacterium]
MAATPLLHIATRSLSLVAIWLSGVAGFAIGQKDAFPISLCEQRFSESGIDVFVTAYSYDPMSQLESGGALLTDPFAPRTATADTYITFAVTEERFGEGGLSNSQKREVTLHLRSDGSSRPTKVTVYFEDIETATAETLKARNLECRLALDGEMVPEVQLLELELSPYKKEWSARCGTVDPDNNLGVVDIGIVDADTREPLYRGRFGTYIPPETLQRISKAIQITSMNAQSGV